MIVSLARPEQVLCFARDEGGATDIVRGPDHPALREWRHDVNLHRDPGCVRAAAEFLRPFQKRFSRALVMFDRQGSGREEKERTQLEQDVEFQLRGSGWADRAAAVCIDPELEAWVWASSTPGRAGIPGLLHRPGISETPGHAAFVVCGETGIGGGFEAR